MDVVRPCRTLPMQYPVRRMNISIAMCTYNGGRYLREQLLSIAGQTFQPWELIICDDGSSDGTEAIVEDFRRTVAFPVRFHRNAVNLGSTKNFEQAISLCTGEAIALCDQDDRWFPEKLGRMAAVLEAEPQVAGVFSNARLMDENGESLPGDLWGRAAFTPILQAAFQTGEAAFQLISRDTVTGATFIFRSSYVAELLPISPEWYHDGWIALILGSIAELRPLPELLISYRLHAEQQVGARQVPWYAHLSTRKQDALGAHLHLERRLSSMADKLETLPAADPAIVAALRRKARFLQRRTAALGLSRLGRLVSATRLLPDYFRYQRGVMSLLRDLFH
jgi:glycosyltransferase involved in cell wall biosynthesis